MKAWDLSGRLVLPPETGSDDLRNDNEFARTSGKSR